MARPFKGDTSHRPKERQCTYCGLTVLKGASMRYKKAFCSKEHMILSMKRSAFNFPCKTCGKAIFTQPAQLKYRARSTCSQECRSELRRREAEERRKTSGFSKKHLNRLIRYSPEAIKWRKSVFERDNFTCVWCGVRGSYLEADHIKPFAFFPELRFELSNGRTLCRPCHNKTKIGYKKMREIYGKVQA